MRFLVFGAGAMGSFIGGSLARVHEVTLVARGEHLRALRERGLTIGGQTRIDVRPDVVSAASEAQPPDVVLIAVKSYDTPAAVRALEPFWGDAIFLSLQNGLGNLEQIAERAARVLGGVTYQGVTFVGPGEVDHAGEGDTVVGAFQGTSRDDTEGVIRAFEAADLAASLTDDVQRVLWAKAVVNACFNPLTGLLRVRSGAMGSTPRLMELSEIITAEAVSVAEAHGVRLSATELIDKVREVSLATAENRSSMLQDLERGRRTEIDAINGAIWRLGVERGIDCPVNRLLAELVKSAEELASSPYRD